MVRVNILNPRSLADQHLIAEYNEILMLISYIKKYPKVDFIVGGVKKNKIYAGFDKNKIKYKFNLLPSFAIGFFEKTK